MSDKLFQGTIRSVGFRFEGENEGRRDLIFLSIYDARGATEAMTFPSGSIWEVLHHFGVKNSVDLTNKPVMIEYDANGKIVGLAAVPEEGEALSVLQAKN